jgi:hypothetical protein
VKGGRSGSLMPEESKTGEQKEVRRNP